MQLESALTLKTVAEMIGSTFEGNPDILITGINEIHMVASGDLTFVDHPKYYSKALGSKATTIIINKQMSPPEGKALIFSDDPFAAYMTLVRRFRPFEKSNLNISPTAVIGEGSVIQPGAFVGNGVKIGRNCIIHANVSIYDNCQLGDRVIIHSGSVIGADAYYFQRKPEGYRKFESCGSVIIGDDVEIGALCAIDKGVSGNTTIDNGTKMDNQVQVGHDSYIGKNCLIGAKCAIAGVTRIEDDVILWGLVAINKDLVIGKGAIMLATSAADKSLEGGKVYLGAPAIDARRHWRELAAIHRLPDIIDKLNL